MAKCPISSLVPCGNGCHDGSSLKPGVAGQRGGGGGEVGEGWGGERSGPVRSRPGLDSDWRKRCDVSSSHVRTCQLLPTGARAVGFLGLGSSGALGGFALTEMDRD
jgi:hypothetical protein